MSNREDLSIIVRAGTEQLASDLARGAAMMRNYAKTLERDSPKALVADEAHSVGMFKNLANAAGTAKSRIAETANSMAGFAVKAAIAGGSLIALQAGLSGIGSAMELVKSSVSMAAEVEQTTIAFQTMLGSVEKTTEVMGDLRKFAAETPFSNKEVTAGARQLLAYGIAANDLIPTLKVLGTISAGTSSPLKDNVYRYGTTRVQGRAYAVDIHQFENEGISIRPGLAKSLGIDETKLHKFIEEGRIGVKELNFALEDLAHNRFGGLLEKQADSLKGTWEQLTDAFDRAKLKLGQVVAQEAGLKSSAKGLESFAGELERAIDSERFREGVRFVGELAKGGAQIAYEFGRAGEMVASLNLDALAKTSPEIARVTENAKALVSSLKDFRFDKRAVVQFSQGVFEVTSYTLADLAESVDTQGKKFKDGFEEYFISPLNDLRSALEDIKGLEPSFIKDLRLTGRENFDARSYLRSKSIEVPVDNFWQKPAMEFHKAATDLPFFNPPRADEPEDQVRARFAFLEKNIKRGSDLVEFGNKQFAPFVDALKIQRGEFLRPFSADPGANLAELKAQFAEGKVPPRRAEWVDIPPPGSSKVNPFKSLRDRGRDYFGAVLDGIARDDMRDAFSGMFKNIRGAEEKARLVANPLGLGAALGPFGNLASGLLGAGGKPDMYLPQAQGLPPHLTALADKINPAHDLKEQLADIEKVRNYGLAPGDQIDKYRAELIRGVGEKMGLGGGESRLPGAALVGSAEDAKLLAQFRSGNQTESVERLLQRILDVLSRSEGHAKEMVREAANAFGIGVATITP